MKKGAAANEQEQLGTTSFYIVQQIRLILSFEFKTKEFIYYYIKLNLKTEEKNFSLVNQLSVDWIAALGLKYG